MTKSLLVPHFLFRYSTSCRACSVDWQRGPLPEDKLDLLPSFVSQLDGRAQFAELRMGWNPRGLLLLLVVRGKREPVPLRREDSGGLQLWVDTRDTHNVHRATRFCHQFLFKPAGGGPTEKEPMARELSIARATASPKPIGGAVLRVRSEIWEDGYRLEGWIPASALTGFDPVEHPRLGVNYEIQDREWGRQTFTVGEEFPMNDPSLWGSVELVRGD